MNSWLSPSPTSSKSQLRPPIGRSNQPAKGNVPFHPYVDEQRSHEEEYEEDASVKKWPFYQPR